MRTWYYTLGPSRSGPFLGNPGFVVRFSEDVRKSVVFVGYADASPGKSGISCIGTGFLLKYGEPGFEIGYLVTAHHVSHVLGHDPFLLRLNRKDGTSENVPFDALFWHEHPDKTIDLALAPVQIPAGSIYDCIYLETEPLVLTPQLMRHENYGAGSFTYTVGLFRLMSGQKRNLPVCHFGTIAALPGDEKIPVKDWRDPKMERLVFVEGYLVETHSLSGLSGSPVFVRPEYPMDISGLPREGPWNEKTDEPRIRMPRDRVRLLGVWQGSWDAPPDQILTAEIDKKGVTVPVGMGIVVPSHRILEILEMPKVKDERLRIVEHFRRSDAASPQAVDRPASPRASDANPKHREDFNSLVNAAARKREQED